MAWIFSKICKNSLKQGKIQVSIPRNVRNRIWMKMKEYDQVYRETTEYGYNYDTTTLERLPGKIKAEHGVTELKAYPEEGGDAIDSNLEGIILRGNYPPYIFDILELLYDDVFPDVKSNFQQDVNQIMEESNLAWRMANGKIFPVNSEYIEEEILRRSQKLLKDNSFSGALDEFEKARGYLANGDKKEAIMYASHALESVMKKITGMKNARPGKLVNEIIKQGIVPQYHEGFVTAFEEHILRAPLMMRNKEKGAGHGQGEEVIEVPRDLAELGVNLSAIMINYLIKRYIILNENNSSKTENELYDDIPF